jgi:hypothetical protein
MGTDHHEVAEILLEVTLNIIKPEMDTQYTGSLSPIPKMDSLNQSNVVFVYLIILKTDLL